MDAEQIPATVDADAQTSTTSLLERTLVSLLRLLASSVRTVRWMSFCPGRFARQVVTRPDELAPPYSFLAISLLLAGIGIRMAVIFFEQPVDHTLLSRLAQTISEIGIEDVFVLTIPCIILVAMSGAGVARWTRPELPFNTNPVVRVMCYSAGFQFAVIGSVCLLVLVSKIFSGKSSVLPGNLFDQITFAGLLLLLAMSSFPVYFVIRQQGTTWCSSQRITAGILSLLATSTVLLGVFITNSLSFDLGSTIQESQRQHQLDNLFDVRVAVRTLSSRMTRDLSGQPAVEMMVGMVNVSDEPVLIPRPFELEHAFDPKLDPLQVIDCSADNSEDPGWIVQPGETKIASWTLSCPQWCSEPQYQQVGLPVTFNCFPLHGTDDVFNVHPIGGEQLILGELSWPLSDARLTLDEQEVERITRMISASKTY